MKEITIDQKIKAVISGVFKDRAGNPATIDGVPVWLTDDVSVTLEPSTDGMECYIVSGDVVDEAVNVRVEMDADLGDGVEPLIGLVETIAVVGGRAKFVELALGDPEAK